MTQLSRQAILDAQDARVSDPIEVPEWGGSVRVRMMSGDERDSWEAWNASRKTEADPRGNYLGWRAALLVRTACDEKGTLLFAPGDVAWLGKKSGEAMDRVVDVAIVLNKLGAAAAEELSGKSQGAPSGASGSGSPGNSANPTSAPSSAA
jgi:hypothetical protein